MESINNIIIDIRSKLRKEMIDTQFISDRNIQDKIMLTINKESVFKVLSYWSRTSNNIVDKLMLDAENN